ncbi:adenylyl-sulfate kinase [Acidovorax facilis]|uniref:adenylyl-sulfate kinase n=1 Tax=Acidovorax facilis TaxID=12917 RepID=UPI003CE946F4
MCQPTGQAFWPWPGWAMTQKNRIWNLFLVHLAGFADIRAKPIRTFSVHPLLLSPFYMPSPDPKAPSGAIPQTFTVVRANREQLAGHRGRVVWFTGFSGAGKSTLANALEVELHKAHKRTYVLDGDNVRRGLCKDLGFSDADRMENMRRVAEVARLFVDAGVVVLVAFISPFRAERQAARELFAAGDFLEVFVDVPLAVAEQRDTKGLYQKARSGALSGLTGIDSPYEPPIAADLVLRTDLLPIEACVTRVLALLEADQQPCVPAQGVPKPDQPDRPDRPEPAQVPVA